MRSIRIADYPVADLSVVALAAGPASHVASFVADHRRLGASHAFVYLDYPATAGDLPARSDGRVTYIPCDAAFWRRLGKPDRPGSVEARQMLVYDDCYRRCATGWLGVCDIDERFVPDGPFGQLLAAVPDDALELRAAPWEAIWPGRHPSFADFTAPYGRRAVTGDANLGWLRANRPLFALLSRKGLLGHVEGKVIVRTGVPDLMVGIHGCKLRGVNVEQSMVGALRLIHYDAIGFESWIAKFEMRNDGRAVMTHASMHRKALTELLALDAGEGFARALFAELYCADGNYLRWLIDQDALAPIERQERPSPVARGLVPRG